MGGIRGAGHVAAIRTIVGLIMTASELRTAIG
jgi:hypothetical protein